MTREAFAQMIYWPWIIWIFGLLNVGAMLPQLVKLIRTKQTQGLSLQMFMLYFVIQIAFSLQGFFTRDTMLMTCLGLSAAVSLVIIALIRKYSRRGA